MSEKGRTPASGDAGRIERLEDLRGRDVLTLARFAPGVVTGLLQSAADVKREPAAFRLALAGRSFALLFEKPSLRTKMSFEVGIFKMGGQPVFMDHSASRLGARESVRDYAKNLERWVDGIIARVYSQTALEEIAEASRRPVVNALSDRYHPCQGLADVFTLFELTGHSLERLRELRLLYVGDGNNVCHSLMHAACLSGMRMTVLTPKGFGPAEDVATACAAAARETGGSLLVTHDLHAAEGHDAVYTDVWVSMGQPGGVDEVTRRRQVFARYQVNADLMERASRGRSGHGGPPLGPVFMHCLPAQRGLEVTDEVIDSPRSVVYDQAENRMWAQNALLAQLFAP